MKWGVRRYQKKDGTLTAAGKARYDKVEQSSKLQKKEERVARKIYKSNRKAIRQAINALNRDTDVGQKSAERALRVAAASSLSVLADEYSKRISDIDQGKVQAGRDFITQIDYNLTLHGLVKEARVINKSEN